MAHKSFDELKEMLHWATTYVTVGGHYKHYKQTFGYYTVTGLSILEATDEVAVRYASSEQPRVEFVRPISSWLDTVVWNNTEVPRFSKI